MGDGGIARENDELRASVDALRARLAVLETRERAEVTERERLETILANMGEAVLVVDHGARVMGANAAWNRMLGPPDAFDPEDETGRPLPAEVWSLRRIVDESPFTLDFTLPAGPDRRWFEAMAQPITDADGDRGGMVVVREITDRSLRRLQERFLAIASHELRTPMTTLSGSLQLIERRIRGRNDRDNLQPLLKRARDQLRRLELITAELTDVARLRGGVFRLQRVTVDLGDVVRQAGDTARDLAGDIPVTVDTPAEPVVISGDPARLEQVLLNLLVNAFRHARGTDRVDLSLRPDGDAAVIEVRDFGAGIPPDMLSDIFSQFQQATDDARSGAGLGLGLYIAREIVVAHGGTIAVDSDGDGTVFDIRLPLGERDA